MRPGEPDIELAYFGMTTKGEDSPEVFVRTASYALHYDAGTVPPGQLSWMLPYDYVAGRIPAAG